MKNFLMLLTAILILNFPLAAEGKRVKLGILIPLSGAFAELGEDCQHGALLAKDLYPDLPVDFLFEDSKADSHTAVTEFRKQINSDKIIGAYVLRSGVGLALNPISKEEKIPLLGGVAYDSFTTQNEYAFQAWSTAKEEGILAGNDMFQNKIKNLALITTSDDYMLAVSSGFRKQAGEVGIKINSDMEVLPEVSDFRPFLLKIKAAGPDAVFANLTINHLGIFLKQLHAAGINAKVYSNFMVAKNDTLAVAGKEALDGIRYVNLGTDYPKLAKQLKAKFPDSSLTGITISAYSALVLALQTLEKNKSISSPVEFYQELAKAKELKLPDLTLPIENRQIKYPMQIGELGQ